MSREETFVSWCRKELSRALGSVVEDDLLDYLVSMEGEKDVREYLQDMLNQLEAAEIQVFMNEFFRHWSPPSHEALSPCNSQLVQEPLVRPHREQLVLYSKEGPPPGFNESVHATPTTVQGSQGDGRSRPKQMFVPLMSVEGVSVTMRLPGRHPCQCLAQKHELINNCVKCGRIVCSQEGSGPCLFCGAIVCTAEEESWIHKDSKKAKKMREQFLKRHNIPDTGRPLEHVQGQQTEGSPSVLTKAQHHKDKLLKFDQTSASRTKVIDDESDYFSVDSNRWLSGDQRDALRSKESSLREQKYSSRQKKALTVELDLVGRKAISEDTVVDTYDEKHAKEALSKKSMGSGYRGEEDEVMANTGFLYNPAIPTDRPEFVDTGTTGKKQKGPDEKTVKQRTRGAPVRLQDRALQEMRDDGMCLSMHQPWATLLVAGIKRCEGRSWYSAHRGRLWIAAASKEPSAAEIESVQQTYLKLYRDKENLFFPLKYPTSCLLGCVDMLDCLSQEEYRETENNFQYTSILNTLRSRSGRYPEVLTVHSSGANPEGESESEYVFIVAHPQELVVKYPIKGQHKLWKLPKDVHQAAKKGLRR